MKKANKMGISFCVITSLMLLSMPINAMAMSNNSERVIVTFNGHVTNYSQKTKVLQKTHGTISHNYKNINAMAISLPSIEVANLRKDPNVAFVEKDVQVKSNDSVDWGVTDIKAPLAWTSTPSITGQGVKIAELDTGIDITQPDLVVTGGVSEVSYTASYNDDNGHGTHVSGIIGAKNNGVGLVGVAPDTSLYAVKVLDSTGSGYVSDIISGIDWAITNKMDIITMSLGTKSDVAALHNAVDSAYTQGVLVVSAGGNDGAGGDTIEYPARYSSVIAVGAVDKTNKRAYFSSTGKELEVSAPGVNIQSTYLNGQYATMSGTSMATPFVAGDLALLKQAHPTYSASQLRSLLQQKVIDLGRKGRDSSYGFGLIQAPVAP